MTRHTFPAFLAFDLSCEADALGHRDRGLDHVIPRKRDPAEGEPRPELASAHDPEAFCDADFRLDVELTPHGRQPARESAGDKLRIPPLRLPDRRGLDQ